MATYISTLNFTDQGVKAIGETTKRAAAMKAAAKKMGGKVTSVYWTMGDYDGLLIFEAPDDETATAVLFYLGSLGNMRTSTARAFTASEVDPMLTRING